MKFPVLFILVVASCVAAPTKSITTEKPAVETPETKIDPNDIAATLDVGAQAIEDEDYELAFEAFRVAVNSDELNSAGEAMAYWSMFISSAFISPDHLDKHGMNYLHDFIVVGEDILEDRQQGLKYIEGDDGLDFVDRFELKRKILHARSIMHRVWKCGTEDFSCEID